MNIFGQKQKTFRLLSLIAVLLTSLNCVNTQATTTAKAASATSSTIYAAVVKSDSNPVGLYQIPTDGSGVLTQVFANGFLKPTGGGCLIGETYYCIVDNSSEEALSAQGFTFNTNPWTWTGMLAPDYKCLATDVAYDPTTGNVYGCFTDLDDSGLPCYVFGTIDYATCTRTKICDLTDKWNAVGVDSEGTIWAIDRMGMLKKVTDKSTGAIQTVSMTMLFPEYNSTGAIDTNTNTFYYSYSGADGTGQLYAIDLDTYEKTKICQYEQNDRLAGMYIISAKIPNNAPAAVSNLKVTFNDGSLSGNVHFKTPTQNLDGSTGTGGLTYSIAFGATEVATGTTQYGQTVDVPVTLESAGNYEVTVTVSNTEGTSPEAKIDAAWYGHDTPQTPDNVKLAYKDDKFYISWDSVTTGANKGYIDPLKVTYNVVRQPDNVCVATNIMSTSFSEDITEPDSISPFYYTVTATYDGKKGNAAISNKIVLGHATPPYKDSFTTEATLDKYTVIDANNDGQRWKVSNAGYAYITYNETLPMDDWLITPAIKLEAGKIYDFSFDASNTKSAGTTIYDEKVEAFMGTEPTVECMVNKVINDTTLTSGNMERLSNRVEVKQTGLYYFGIHGCSDAGKWYLMVNNISISAGINAEVPGKIADLSIVPDTSGALTADISFTSPDTTSTGSELLSLTHIDIQRNGVTIKSFDHPTIGSILTYKDSVARKGIYTYSAIPYNMSGAGLSCSEKVYIGLNEPAAPASASAIETDKDGEVTITWEPSTLGINGYPLNTKDITYTVYDNKSDTPIANIVNGTSFTYQALEPNSNQQFKYFYVFSNANAGKADGQYSQHAATTNQVAVGKPYPIPFTESFNEDSGHDYVWGYERPASSLATWELVAENVTNTPIATPLDADSAMLKFTPIYQNDEALFYSAKIDIAEATTPVLSFYYYAVKDGRDEFDVMVRNAKQKDYTCIRTIALGDAGITGWKKCIIRLKDVCPTLGNVIQIAFNGRETEAKNYILIDNVRIGDLNEHDLSALSLFSQSKIEAGSPITVNIAVENIGSSTSNAYSVELYRNGEFVTVIDRPALAADSIDRFTYDDITNIMTETPMKYSAKIVYADDSDTTNNISRTSTTVVTMPTYPTISDLSATMTADGVRLTWTAPQNATYTEPTTDTFEEYEGWTTGTIGNWMTVNGNNSYSGGIKDVNLPIENTTASFFIFDCTNDDMNRFRDLPHSGSKFIASIFKHDEQNYVKSNDWLISPELSGSKQTISFYASSYTPSYPESFEIYYSATDRETSSFIRTETRNNIAQGWTKYEFTIPAGAKYFAIRCISNNMFMLMIDDITYEPASSVKPLAIMGYNIYRNGVKITEEPVAETSFVDSDAPLGTVTYNVSVVYDRGESAISNSAEVNTTSIETPNSSITAKITTDKNTIHIYGAEKQPIYVYTTNGRLIHSTIGSNHTNVYVSSGIYIVKIGKKATKVIVH